MQATTAIQETAKVEDGGNLDTLSLFWEVTSHICVGLVVLDSESLVFANDKAPELLDIPVEYFEAGRPWIDFLRYACERGDFGTEHEPASILDRLIAEISAGNAFTEQRTVANGRTLLIEAKPRSNGGQILTCSDVTPQARLLRDSNDIKERIERFADTAADWFWAMDEDLRFNYFSRNAHDAGIDTENVLGRTRRELIEAANREKEFREHLETLEAHESFRDFIYQMTNRAGEKIWVSVSGTPVFRDDGSFEGYVGAGRNVTEDVEQRRALERTKRDLQMTLKALNVSRSGIMIHSGEEIVHANSSAVERLELHPAYLTKGRSTSDMITHLLKRGDFGDAEGVAHAKAAIRAFKENPDRGLEIEFTTPKGRIISSHSTPGTDGVLISTFNDITELRCAEKNALAADRAKSEFLANMSHEIRTPLNGVMGMAELLAKTELNAKQRMFTDVIVKSGSSLLTIINDILDFSKLDAGQMELDPAPFVFADAIEDVATLVSSRAAEKDVELIVRVDPALPKTFVGDVGRLRQVVTNLVGNAVKFTPCGHVFVNATKAETAPADTDSMRLRIEVEDTGIGVPKAAQAHIFEKFSQVDGSATRKHEGSGLGLSISSSLVKLMGGEIGVESEEGSGAKFWFEIDLPCHGAAKPEPVFTDITGARLLIVDDNSVNREILCEQAANWKLDAAAVASGSEALSMLHAATRRGVRIDCIILDYQMPEVNGGDVLKKMREFPQLAEIPVIMLTSVEQTVDGKSFSALGVQSHLVKPTRSALLLETIADVIASDRALKGKARETDDLLPASWLRQNEAGASPVRGSTKVFAQRSEAARPVLRSETAAQPKAKADPAASKIDILLCEDNEINQIVFSEILDASPYSYRIANDGRKSLVLFDTETPSLVLMDVSMPHMNGLEATVAIREREEKAGRKRAPIIGVTAHALKGDMEKCLAVGMDDYLPKPVSFDSLMAKIEKWMPEAAKTAAGG